MSATASWQFSVDGVGGRRRRYAVGRGATQAASSSCASGLGADDGTDFAVRNLGGSQVAIALEATALGQSRGPTDLRPLLELALPDADPARLSQNTGMMLWIGGHAGYASGSDRPRADLTGSRTWGRGRSRSRRPPAAYPGQYLSAVPTGPGIATSSAFGVRQPSLSVAGAGARPGLGGDLLAAAAASRTRATGTDLSEPGPRRGLDLGGRRPARSASSPARAWSAVTSICRGPTSPRRRSRGVHLWRGLDLSHRTRPGRRPT